MQIERPVRFVTITLENEYEIDLFNKLLAFCSFEGRPGTPHLETEAEKNSLERLWNQLFEATDI
jgi:hypothetical protein